jgi:hypothetical protein
VNLTKPTIACFILICCLFVPNISFAQLPEPRLEVMDYIKVNSTDVSNDYTLSAISGDGACIIYDNVRKKLVKILNIQSQIDHSYFTKDNNLIISANDIFYYSHIVDSVKKLKVENRKGYDKWNNIIYLAQNNQYDEFAYISNGDSLIVYDYINDK